MGNRRSEKMLYRAAFAVETELKDVIKGEYGHAE